MAIGEMGRRASTRRSSLTALAICTRAAPVRRGSLEPVLSCEEISDLDEQSSAKECHDKNLCGIFYLRLNVGCGRDIILQLVELEIHRSV